jgi:hypothetical protein
MFIIAAGKVLLFFLRLGCPVLPVALQGRYEPQRGDENKKITKSTKKTLVGVHGRLPFFFPRRSSRREGLAR